MQILKFESCEEAKSDFKDYPNCEISDKKDKIRYSLVNPPTRLDVGGRFKETVENETQKSLSNKEEVENCEDIDTNSESGAVEVEEEEESDQDSFNSMAVRVEVEESDKDTASEELQKEFAETFEPLEETEEDCTENEGVMKIEESSCDSSRCHFLKFLAHNNDIQGLEWCLGQSVCSSSFFLSSSEHKRDKIVGPFKAAVLGPYFVRVL